MIEGAPPAVTPLSGVVSGKAALTASRRDLEVGAFDQDTVQWLGGSLALSDVELAAIAPYDAVRAGRDRVLVTSTDDDGPR